MKCDEALTHFGALVDDELPTDTTAIVMQHIAACLECQKEWDAQLHLNKQFQQLEDSITIPALGLERIDKRISALNSFQTAHLGIVAAAIVACGLLCIPFLQHKPEKQSTVFEQVFQTYPTNPLIATSSEPIDAQLKNLSPHVKFKPSPNHLPGWTLASADVLHLPGHVCLLRMIYQADGAGKKTVAVYQSCKGQLTPHGLRERVIAGRHLYCGQVNGLAVIHWSDAERDQLFVSSLSEDDLISLALKV